MSSDSFKLSPQVERIQNSCPDYKVSRQISQASYDELVALDRESSTDSPSPDVIADVDAAIAEMRARKLKDYEEYGVGRKRIREGVSRLRGLHLTLQERD